MKRMIFEDDKKSSISQMLLLNYTEEQLLFTNGNGNIVNVLKDISKNDFIVVFFDLSPEIKTLIQTYNKLLKFIGEKEYKKVFVVPIPCIGYFVLKEFAFKQLTTQEQKILNFNVYYKALGLRYRTLKSFEKVCKEILNTCSMPCIAVSEEYSLVANKFYHVGCACDSSDFRCFNNLTRSDKCRRLHQALPIHFR